MVTILNANEIEHAQKKGMPYGTQEEKEAVIKSYNEEHPQEEQQKDHKILDVSQFGESTQSNKQEEEQEEEQQNNSKKVQNESGIVQANSDKAITEYTGPLNFFNEWAEKNNCTFKQNEEDTEVVSGTFFDKESNEEKGRVSVSEKNDKASSDIAGIEALVEYAKAAGYESITLGECSEEYAAKMKAVCEAMGIELVIKDRENVQNEQEENSSKTKTDKEEVNAQKEDEHKAEDTQKPIALPNGENTDPEEQEQGNSTETPAITTLSGGNENTGTEEQEQGNPTETITPPSGGNENTDPEKQEQSNPTETPEIIALSDGNGNENEQIITVGEEKNLGGEKINNNNKHGAPDNNIEPPLYEVQPRIAESRLARYAKDAQTKAFDKEIANSEVAYSKKWFAQAGEEKGVFDILLRKYAKADAMGAEEDKNKIEKAMQFYGVDTISIESDNNGRPMPKITNKKFADRSPEEQTEIKNIHDNILSEMEKNGKETVKSAEQSLTAQGNDGR